MALSCAWGRAGCGASAKGLHCHCRPLKPTGQWVGLCIRSSVGVALSTACALAKAASAASSDCLARAWFWLAIWSINTLRAL